MSLLTNRVNQINLDKYISVERFFSQVIGLSHGSLRDISGYREYVVDKPSERRREIFDKTSGIGHTKFFCSVDEILVAMN